MSYKEDFTIYDIKPEYFENYLRYYGSHFSKKLCEFACNKLFGKMEYDKDKLRILLQANMIDFSEMEMDDAVYIANWCKYVFFGSSVPEEKHIALFIKDIYAKEEDLIFNRFIADCAKKGIPIQWEEMI